MIEKMENGDTEYKIDEDKKLFLKFIKRVLCMCIGWYKIKTFKKWLQKRERINNKQYIFAIIINYILQNSLF